MLSMLFIASSLLFEGYAPFEVNTENECVVQCDYIYTHRTILTQYTGVSDKLLTFKEINLPAKKNCIGTVANSEAYTREP
jgi:hypothetical protein